MSSAKAAVFATEVRPSVGSLSSKVKRARPYDNIRRGGHAANDELPTRGRALGRSGPSPGPEIYDAATACTLKVHLCFACFRTCAGDRECHAQLVDGALLCPVL